MQLEDKLAILADSAKYDVACTSSGVDRRGNGTGMGNSWAAVWRRASATALRRMGAVFRC